jgi:CHAT domain-containing protein/tetratricopeptide (TPR) repeat protein
LTGICSIAAILGGCSSGSHIEGQEDAKVDGNGEFARIVALSQGMHDEEALSLLGVLAAEQTEAPARIELYRRAVEALEATSQWSALADALILLAGTAEDAGAWKDAIEARVRAAHVLRKLGKLSEARSCLISAREMADRIGSAAHIALVSHSLGVVERDAGSPGEALKLFGDSYEYYKDYGSHSERAVVLKSLGATQLLVGRFEEATQSLRGALANSRAQGLGGEEASILTELGWALHLSGRSAEAKGLFTEAIALFRKSGETYGEAGALDRLGSAHRELGEFELADAAYQSALTILETEGYDLGRAHTLANICELELAKAERHRAPRPPIESCLKASELLEGSDDKIASSHAHFLLARALRLGGRLPEAGDAIAESLDLLDVVWRESVDTTSRETFLKSRQSYLEEALLIMLGEQPGEATEKTKIQALKLVDRFRGRGYLRMLPTAGEPDPELLAQEARIRSEIIRTTLGHDWSRSDEQQDERLQSRLLSLQIAHESVARQLAEAMPQIHDVVAGNGWESEELQRRLADDDEVLISYFLGARCSLVWWVTPDSVGMTHIPSREEIEVTIEASSSLLESGGASASVQTELALARLGELLIEPVWSQIEPYRNLVIVPDSALFRVPFSALGTAHIPDAKTDERNPSRKAPLVASKAIRIVPSVGAALYMETKAKMSSATRRVSIAIFSDPVFDLTDSRIRNKTHFTPPAHEATWKRLPSSRNEADQIRRLAVGSEVLDISGFEANRERFLGGDLEHFDVIHFATHGVYHDTIPEVSGVVLSLVSEEGSPQNGFLSVQDVALLRLRARLVVLSSCQSALAGRRRGTGTLGLVAGFIAAGSDSVLASLWPVEDKATAYLMKLFYEGLLLEDLTPSEALQRAQQRMLDHHHWFRPRHWAAFAVYGAS